MDYDEIVYERRHDAAWIGINRPEVRNAFREQTLDELADALNSTREDPTIVAAVVYGVGGRFSAGGDFHAMMKLNKANSYMWNDRMQKVAMTCRNLPIPVIAMVEGACVGGGHELMLWCDLVIAADDSIFGQTGARVGACPTVGATQYIGKLIGERRAKEMIFLCKRYSGKEAASIGLANESVPADQLRILANLDLPILASDLPYADADLIVDGIIGYSLQGAPRGRAAELIQWANDSPALVLALDAPSGLDTTSGTLFDPAIVATATLTLALPKEGLRHPDAAWNVGELYLGDISVPPQLYGRPPLELDVGPIFAESDVVRLA